MKQVYELGYDVKTTRGVVKPNEYEVDENDCWVCISHYGVNKEKSKRPVFLKSGKIVVLARAIFEHHKKRKIKKGMSILHFCDNERCINPNHLREGTQRDNIQDMVSRGRANPCKGESHKKARLTDKEVYEIKKLMLHKNYSTAELSSFFGVNEGTIRRIKRGESWKHVTLED